jgi:hypothetical protein
MAAMTLVLIEAAAWLGLCWMDGGWASRRALRDPQAAPEAAAGEEGGDVEGTAEGTDKQIEDALKAHARWQYRSVLHPFLGMVLDPDHPANTKAPAYNPEAAQYGLPFTTEPLFMEPSEDKVIVGIFGGSVASIFGTAGRRALTRQLASYPRFEGKQIAIISLGVGGYKQPQQLMELNYLLSLGSHFDIVINLDGFNEVALSNAELRPQMIFPHYPRNWRQMTEGLGQELRLAIGRLAYLRERQAGLAEAFRREPWRWSWTAELVYRLRDGKLNREIEAAEQALLAAPESAGEGYQLHGPARRYKNDAAFYRDIAEVWERSSLQMARLCEGLGIEYYHFLQPNQYVEGSKPLTEQERREAFREDQPYRPGVVQGYPVLQEMGAELVRQGVSYHDATGVFADVDKTLYFDTCCHFNIAGNRYLARLVADVIGPAPAAR